ncbi:MAG: hypothetical protein IJW45_03120 [Oscillospiraceae bacterium]|nr:hypothetical protein [Oscillospiraceae bacterium]
MRGFTELFLVDGQPLLVPDADVAVAYSDIESEDSGRDEMAVMHRIVLRQDVGCWSFQYGSLSEEEKRYMERLFQGKAVFDFTHPDRVQGDREVTVRAYRSGYGIVWHDARKGQWRDYKFDIVEC